MKSAYNSEWLYNLAVNKETRRWFKEGFITEAQLPAIREAYPSGFYHPNFIIRILLFVATLLALSGVTGLLGLMVGDFDDEVIWTGCILYGVISFIVLEKLFINNNKHFKSGVNEALLYHACGFTIGGMAALIDGEPRAIFISCLLVFSFSAIRYLDLVTTLAAFMSLAGWIFYEFYNWGGVYQQIIPFVFILVFTPVYIITKISKSKDRYALWNNNLILLEALSLLLIYAAGNYLVVRELSESLMDLYIEEGSDLPFAFVFYTLTVIIPIAYLFFGIKNKDVVLLRVSLVAFAFSVFTFKYYYGFGHPEFSLTIAGAIIIVLTIWLLNYLKTIRNGYTREQLLAEKWGNMNLQAIIISQTMGGNQVTVDEQFKGEGGGFGGGGASGDY